MRRRAAIPSPAVSRRAALITLAAVAASGATARAQTEAPVRVGTSPADAFAEGVYADAGGFFKAAGLTVELVSTANSGAMGAAVAGGAIDIGLGNAIAIANAREQGLQFTAIAPSALFSAAEPASGATGGRCSCGWRGRSVWPFCSLRAGLCSLCCW